MKSGLMFIVFVLITSLFDFAPAAPACKPGTDHLSAGIDAFERHNPGQAIERYTCAVELGQAEPEAYNLRGLAYREIGDYRAAVTDFTQAIALSDQAIYYSNRGWAHYQSGNNLAALFDYDTALTLDPTLAEAYYNRGLVHYKRQDYQKALHDYERALALGLEN